ncbi:MAG TPA: competence/damage-inducible protein A [Acidobacteriaceae bacterium]|nr:competence/damage-inducible protein A [Acidobacteriaceae bacterium]
MNCEIIAVGSELLTPYRQDTNSLFLTERLNQLGIAVIFKTIVGDRRPLLTGAIRVALDRADVIITMGGLGPTEDDLTRQSVADALGIRLRRNPEIVGALYARFAARRTQMTENNARQADVLDGSVILENDRGTAPGQWLDTVHGQHRKLVILLPGPPSEVKAMFDLQCMERLRAIAPKRLIAKRVLKAAMIGESQADSRIAPIYTRYHDVETTILAHTGDITLNLSCTKSSLEAAQERVEDLAEKIEEELGEFIYSSQGESLEQIVLDYLGMHGATLAVAESCTGGLISQRLTGISGSSRSFLGGAIVYSDALKTTLADVPASMIEEHGAVSREVAGALADGIRRKTSATFGIGVTGIAGPAGGTEEKPVGLVYVAVSDGKQTDVVERRFGGERETIRSWASQQALDLVRRRLM